MVYKKELDKIGGLLRKNQQTVAVAESVTSGLIQNVLANAEYASVFFEGGITAYNLQQKCRLLHVDPVNAITCNCVSEEIAREMALGVADVFKSNWSVAITGYAAPIPEQGLEDLFACYAISFNKEIVKVNTISAIKESPSEVQHFYMLSVVEDFIQCCHEMQNKI